MPFAVTVGVTSPLAAVLAKRIGTKIPVVAGLLLMAAGLAQMGRRDGGLGLRPLRHGDRADGRRDGARDGARDGVDHGRAAARAGRRGFRGQRHDARDRRRHGRRRSSARSPTPATSSNLGDAAAHLPAPAADAASSSLAGALAVAHQAPAASGTRSRWRRRTRSSAPPTAASSSRRSSPSAARCSRRARCRRAPRATARGGGRVDGYGRVDAGVPTADERREAVLDAAVHEFARAGYHAASTTNIAKRAGISQPYIYALFPNKKTLFIAVQERVSQRIRDAFVEAAREATSREDRIERMGEGVYGPARRPRPPAGAAAGVRRGGRPGDPRGRRGLLSRDVRHDRGADRGNPRRGAGVRRHGDVPEHRARARAPEGVHGRGIRSAACRRSRPSASQRSRPRRWCWTPRRRVAKACELLGEAAAQGARLAVLPEVFVPLYQSNAWARGATAFGGWDELWERLWENSVDVGGPHVQTLVDACARHDIHCVIGVNEREDERPGSLYNAMLTLGPEGLVHRHRKLMPTMQERIFHGFGAGDDLAAVELPGIGRVGGLICWENRMPLARYAVYEHGPADLGRADRRRQRGLARLDAPHRDRGRRVRRLGAAVHPGRRVPRRLPGAAAGGQGGLRRRRRGDHRPARRGRRRPAVRRGGDRGRTTATCAPACTRSARSTPSGTTAAPRCSGADGDRRPLDGHHGPLRAQRATARRSPTAC